MTFVAARRFGERIVIVSDTKITNPSGALRRGSFRIHTHDYLPGRLKAFPLAVNLSVAYAGNSGRALSVLRYLSRNIDRHSPGLRHAINHLRLGSIHGDVDFLVASHIEKAEIFKIANGAVTTHQDAQWIGDPSVIPIFLQSIEKETALRERMRVLGAFPELGPEYGTAEEHDFRRGWTSLLLQNPLLSPSVGGIPVVLQAFPNDHSFLNTAGAYNPESFVIWSHGTTDHDGRPFDPLSTQYSYCLAGCRHAGFPIIGLWLQEANTGYIYDPIVHDEATALYNTTLNDLDDQISMRVRRWTGK